MLNPTTRPAGRNRLPAAVLMTIVATGAVRADDVAPPPEVPQVAPASDAAEKAIAGFQVPQGMTVELVAAEPALANGVCFCFDGQGRIYVAETFRQEHGVEDNRAHMTWVDDDLAARTVEDRLAFFHKHLGQRIDEYAKCDDRIRRLEDTDGDGKYEKSTVFADRFNGILEGTGAGLLAHQGDVFYTCIPNLWRLQDTRGTGVADRRTVLSTGYGVHVAYRGHDMHGLCLGPDGKVYFSIGDRGFNVRTPDGRQLAYPDRGAVLRCQPDGSELEVVHEGLRNPQELAFDDQGNLFTADNNCDSVDLARWVYIVEGGDSGWRMNYQYLADRGPWNQEKLWELPWEGQAAWLLPPLAHISEGPAGLASYPGVGLAEKYRGHFFLADFRGTAAGSGIHSFALRPKGAAFDIVDREQFFWGVLATDCDFALDGSFHVLDWAESWEGRGKGRIYRLRDESANVDRAASESRRLLAADLRSQSPAELIALLRARRSARAARGAVRASRSGSPGRRGAEPGGNGAGGFAGPVALHLGPGHDRPPLAAGPGRRADAARRRHGRSPRPGGQSARRRPGGRRRGSAHPPARRRQPARALAGRAGAGQVRRAESHRAGAGHAAGKCRPRRLPAARRRDDLERFGRRANTAGRGSRSVAGGTAGGAVGPAAIARSRDRQILARREPALGGRSGAGHPRRADRRRPAAIGGDARAAGPERTGDVARA